MRKFGPTLAVAGAVAVVAGLAVAADETTVDRLAAETHFHGLAVDAADASRLYLATHHGLYVVGPGGKARRISEGRDDFMGFTAHPTDRSVLYASGHPAGGGNLGFIVSTDGGRTWRKLADGHGGPVDFHQMAVSKADPKVIYGIHGDLQASADGGRTWRRVGPAPERTYALAASSQDVNTLYAATQSGLLRSNDGGKTWRSAHTLRSPSTMVQVTGSGKVYAFIAGIGLVQTEEASLNWRALGGAWGGDYVLHLAAAPGDGQRLFVVTLSPRTNAQAVLASQDGGATWVNLAHE